MSDLGLQFVLHARRVQLVDEQPPVIHAAESSFMKFCSHCFEIMPHVRKEDYSQCCECGLKTYPKKLSEQGSSCLEFIFLLAVVAFVLLVVLKDVPW